jgi:MFS family permease
MPSGLTLTTSATYVALVQTAASLPVVLIGVLAGAAGDLLDRRQFLLVTLGLMLVHCWPPTTRPVAQSRPAPL